MDDLLAEPAAFRVEQEHFTGGVAELAHALRSRALAPEQIDLYQLVKAYLEYLDAFAATDLELATEALPRVAQVLELKIRLLLPRAPTDETIGDEVLLEEALEAVMLLEELEDAIEFLRRRRLERRLVVPAKAPRPDYPRALRPQTASPSDLARLAGRYRIGGYFELAIERSTIAGAVRDIMRALRTGAIVDNTVLGYYNLRLRKLTSEILAGALADLATNENYRRNAGDVAEKLRSEDGAQKAIKVIERVMANYVPRMPKAKKARKVKKPALKLVG